MPLLHNLLLLSLIDLLTHLKPVLDVLSILFQLLDDGLGLLALIEFLLQITHLNLQLLLDVVEAFVLLHDHQYLLLHLLNKFFLIKHRVGLLIFTNFLILTLPPFNLLCLLIHDYCQSIYSVL